jgi:Skp family chaperone for outer membrane proteins
MNMFFKSALLATALAAAPIAANAQVATADLNAAVQQSAAFQAAQTSIKTTYKTQIDAANTRAQALSNQLQPMEKEIETLQANKATPPATLQAKVNAYRTAQQNAQREIGNLSAPFQRPTLYAAQQVEDKLDQAVKAAMTAKGVKIIVSPQAVLAVAPEANMTNDIVAQLNTLVKTVSTTPPANWQPGQPTTPQAASR